MKIFDAKNHFKAPWIQCCLFIFLFTLLPPPVTYTTSMKNPHNVVLDISQLQGQHGTLLTTISVISVI